MRDNFERTSYLKLREMDPDQLKMQTKKMFCEMNTFKKNA